MFEDMIWEGLQAFNVTQNIIIGRMLEIQAIQENERREIAKLLGYEDSAGKGKITQLNEMLEKEFPKFDFDKFGVNQEWLKAEEKRDEKKEKEKNLKENWEKFQEGLESFKEKSKQTLSKLGLHPLLFAYKTPYEKLMFERMTKQMQRGPGVAFAEVDSFLKKKAGVPGA